MKVYHTTYTVSLNSFTDSCNIFLRCCQRFFDQDIFLGICHCACDICVCKIWCYNRYCIDFLIGCHIMIVCIYFTDSKFIRNLSGSCFIHIANCYRIRKKMFCIDRRMCASPGTSSNNTHSDLFNFHSCILLLSSIMLYVYCLLFYGPGCHTAYQMFLQ